jgi:F5/8 type C domain/Right handed beta helix region
MTPKTAIPHTATPHEAAPVDVNRRHRQGGPVARRVAAAVAAGACAAALAGAAPFATTASAAPHPHAADRPAAAAAVGASTPFTTYEAENAATNGTKIGPDYTQGTVASEASGRQAVQLGSQGQFVEFTLTKPANAVDVDYNLPDGRSGTLSVYVNGTKLSKSLQVTSKYSYVSTGNIMGSKTHHLFDDARVLLGQNVAAGAKVRLQVDSGDNAGPYVIDLADFEQVADAGTQPSNSISVVSDGADPSGNGDSTNAFNQAISAAKSQGKEVWVPPGDFKISNPLPVDGVTIRGAGNWYSVLHSSHLIDQGNASGNTKLFDFAVFGEVTERNDSSPDNFVNGSLGANSVVQGLWIQHEKVGMWLTGNNDNLLVQNNRILDTTADGINLNGTSPGVTIKNNYIRNTGDDGLAMWSLNRADSNSSFVGNTVVQPNLANGIAIYGGTNNTVQDNVVADTNALGSGIAISNQAFGAPFFPLSGTITVSGNTLIRAGAINPNWGHPMGALRVDSYDSDINATVNINNTTFTNSPYSAFEFVSGSGVGHAVRNVNINGATVNNAGTVVMQAETQGSVSVSNVTADGVGAAGIYNCPFPTGSGTFTLQQGSGNSGWNSTWNNCNAWPAQGGGNPGGGGGTPPPSGNLALSKAASDTGHADVYASSNAVDGNADTYWESTNNAFPQSITVDLGSANSVKRLVLKLPPASAWATRTETLSVLGSTNNSSYSTLAGSQGYTFNPSSGNTATITLGSAADVRYLRLTFTANTGWPAAQLSELEAYGS